MKSTVAPVEIAPLTPSERPLWQAFLAESANGTLFHDLAFLDYHPADRFRFAHLVLRQKNKILALVPGGLATKEEGEIFVSPLGASVGGPAVAKDLTVLQGLALTQALQAYARERGWAGLELTLPPAFYAQPATDILPFALFGRGFRLANRWLSAMLDLSAASAPRYDHLFSKRQKTYARSLGRKGMEIRLGGVELLPLFLEVFADTYARHGKQATHTPEEIESLLTRHPNEINLALALMEERCAAGVLLFRVAPSVTNTFYICSGRDSSDEKGLVFLLAELADMLAERGIRWLDLGPTCWDGNYNAGVTFFKESLGCATACRDRWIWRAAWTEGPPLAHQNFISSEA
jgi:hypothetical protein